MNTGFIMSFDALELRCICTNNALCSPSAQQHLNGIRIFGKEIRVSKSKHTTVNMPRDEDEVSCVRIIGMMTTLLFE